MKQNKIDRFVCSIWFFVPILSLIRLSQPMMEIDMGAGIASIAAMPVKVYNGFQLLFCRYLINGYNSIVTDMSNPGFDILKMMIVLQLVCDVILISICLREWREKQTNRIFLRLRGILSIGYVLTAFAIYRFVPVCGNYLKKDWLGSYIFYNYQYELEKNILFSIGVVVLFMVTWLFFRTGSVYKFICYLWFFVPVLSLIILMLPAIEIGVEDDDEPVYSIMIDEEEEDIELTTEVKYNQFQLLLYGSLVNVYKDTVVGRKNIGFVIIKIMIALQLLFDVIIVFIGLWEWRKKQNPKFLLCLRGILTMGYVLTAFAIYRFVETRIEPISIDHYSSHSYLPRTSYVSWFYYFGVDFNVSFSIGVVVLFMITWLFFGKEKAIKIRREKPVNRKDDLHDTE